MPDVAAPAAQTTSPTADPRAARDAGVHGLAWGVWALAGVAAVQIAPSPPVVVVLLAIAALVVTAHGQGGPLTRAFGIIIVVAIVFVVLRVVLTGLTVQSSEAVLVDLPSVQLPLLLGGFVVGGAVSTQAVLGSLAEGVAIIGVLGVFGAFNAVVRHVELIRAAPRAFHELGLVVTVALAFVPSVIASVTAVREADLARTGGVPRRRGRVLRLLVPVLEGGVERAMSLAETLDARGFGHAGPTRGERRAAVVGALGMLAAVAAFAAFIGRARGVGVVLGLLAVVLVVAAVVAASRATRRPRYRPRPLRRQDVAIGLAAVATPVALGALSAAGSQGLIWLPSQSVVPIVDPLALLALAGMAAPAALAMRRQT